MRFEFISEGVSDSIEDFTELLCISAKTEFQKLYAENRFDASGVSSIDLMYLREHRKKSDTLNALGLPLKDDSDEVWKLDEIYFCEENNYLIFRFSSKNWTYDVPPSHLDALLTNGSLKYLGI